MIKSTLIAALLSSLSYQAMADWTVHNEQSSVSFVTLKQANVMESHHFKNIGGEITATGDVSITIDLSSVDTAISIRDERMQQYLFETSTFSTATLNANIAPSILASIKVNDSKVLAVNATLSLHGQVHKIAVNVSVTRLSNNSLLVASVKPVLIHANDFSLVKGIEKLRQLAGLKSISHTVPVSFVLRLNN